MSLLDADDLIGAVAYILVKGPGYGLVLLINKMRGYPMPPSERSCWLAGIAFWVFAIGVGWIVLGLSR